VTLFVGLDAAFLDIVRVRTAGDPMREGVRWTNYSLRRIARELKAKGFPVCTQIVRRLLKRHRLGRRRAKKNQTIKQHKDRDRQFRRIAQWRATYEGSSNPIISMDTKKKELIGKFFRAGEAYTDAAESTWDHDFPSLATGVVYPHGFYDYQRNQAHINLGINHDTSEFACDSLVAWWTKYGQITYPQANSILILCDGGGSNASSRYVFKYWLERAANRIGRKIRIAPYPPYTSKYNPIEHLFFPHVTHACQGVIFQSVEVVRDTMSETRTTQGLQTTVDILPGDYKTGIKAPKDYKKNMRIVFDEELPKWNYRAIPATETPKTGS
jgi:hypothetical protein